MTPPPPPGDDYDRFVVGVKTLTTIDLALYRRPQMERRLRTFARRQKCDDLDQYLALLRADAEAVQEFRDRMTINVSELFRNADHFRALERDHLPRLLAEAGSRPLKVWSAGCSYGAEIYSVAIQLQELAPGRRQDLQATDIDPFILERAKAGMFRDADMKNVSAERARRWFSPAEDDGEPRHLVDTALRTAVKFRRHDLLKDPYPQGMDLICCRNVVIYFTDDAKEQIYRRFLQALRPGGILFIGATERIADAEQLGYGRAGMFFYSRPE